MLREDLKTHIWFVCKSMQKVPHLFHWIHCFQKKIIEASFDFPRIASQSPKQLQQSVSLPLDRHLSHELAKRGTGLIEWFKICHIDCSNLSNDYLLLLKEVVPGHHEEWFLMLPSGLPRRLTGPPVLWITPPAKQRMNRMAQLAEPMASWPWVAKNSFVGLKGDHASQRRRKRTFYIHEREKGNKKIGDGRYNKAIPTCYNLWNVMSALIQFWPSSTKQSTFRKIAPSNQTSHNKKVRRTWYGKAITSKVPHFENCWLVFHFARKTVLFQVQNMEGMCVCVCCACCKHKYVAPIHGKHLHQCASKQPWTKKEVEPSTNSAPSKNFAPS